ncbi:hypothetical protein CAOG_07373 [Capsaspora owczarzaki ATCC 30864]|uniref:2OG-Fe(II) oxygenase n=1 Tax=Capsaspora owczarzaki (strain ATCC 30864) TaxID=595528 RepID=A0A0D2WXM8_CAPO3|nr:hypothetical protein CAOG_07373 [Capsaspora owczarzaki ATCC 30864]KJE97533.1 hypothetical protein, variant [Capsaspora owczarzaki ATCC 30864]|eukprot:XP_004343232.1 hypothetical protein CAOG_07373 [Capsaspora owczarzaki ATCC 30864]
MSEQRQSEPNSGSGLSRAAAPTQSVGTAAAAAGTPWFLLFIVAIAALAAGVVLHAVLVIYTGLIIVPQQAFSTTTSLGGSGSSCDAVNPRVAMQQHSAPDYSIDWLESLEARMRNAQAAETQLPAGGLMTMAWTTPIYRVNLAGFKVDVPKFNSRLAASIITQFQNLVKENPDKLVSSGADDHGANQAFYDWQRKGSWNVLQGSREGQALRQFIMTGVGTYFQMLGESQDFVNTVSGEMTVWATLHHSGIFHMPHSHPHELLSGVFYVKMPGNAGKIIFSDPRGPLTPFDNTIAIEPREGDLILFPSWLTHMVAPTSGSDERISIAFNIPGDWTMTANVRTDVPVGFE